MEVNQKQLSQYLGISTRRIRDLRKEGLFQKVNDKVAGYDLARCIQEYIEYKVNAETGRRAYASKEEVQARHEEVKKEISLLKLRHLRRELHEAADVEEFLSDMLVRFRNRMLAVAPRVAMKVAGETDISTLTEIIHKEMAATLEELSEYDPDEIDGMDLHDYDDDSDDEEDEKEEME
ncbi:MAG: DNA-packaging protein [Eubacterium sp.]|nr:DNA-packaging protein [Eubacterium sp.]